MERRTVNFFSEGARLEGDLMLPSDLKTGERRPGIVLCHGFTGVRSFFLEDYAKVFVRGGFAALTFDYRGWGGSEGEKWRLIPIEQVDDIRNAISFLEAQAMIDPERLGLWGTSYGGAHAPYVAAVDTRVKAAVGQVGFAEGDRFLLDVRGYGERVELLHRIAADRKRRAFEGVSEKVNSRFLLCSSQSVEFARKRAEANPGAPISEVTLETAEKTMEYKPLEVVDRIAPRALLLIGARDDNVCPIEGYQKLHHERANPRSWRCFR
jgi:uncharacterized protein